MTAAITVDRATLIADLRAGATAIRRLGWTRGTFWDRNRGVCAVGGIATAVHGDIPTRVESDGVKRYTTRILTPQQRWRLDRAEKAVDDHILRHQLLPGLDPAADAPAGHTVDLYATTDWNDNQCQSGEQAAALLEAVADELEQQGGGRP